jgi:malate permease and related proteins
MIADILLSILAPILLLIGLGALLQWKFRLDLNTLSKLNIYLFTPAFIFDNVYRSRLSWSDMAGVATITVVQCLALGALVFGVGRALGVGRQTLAAVALAVMMYNSGNFGLPLAELAYPGPRGEAATTTAPATATANVTALSPARDGGAVQAFVVMTMNVLTFTVGLSIAAYAGDGDARRAAAKILQMPSIYALAAALAIRWYLGADAARAVPVFISKSSSYLAGGLVPMALITLGAQLGKSPRWPNWKAMSAVLGLRLVVAPILMAGMLWTLHKLGAPAMFNLWPHRRRSDGGEHVVVDAGTARRRGTRGGLRVLDHGVLVRDDHRVVGGAAGDERVITRCTFSAAHSALNI